MNKNKLLISLISCFVIFFNTGLHAQDNTEKEHNKVGLGVSLFNMQDLYLLADGISYWGTVYIPISVSDKFRFEPDFGFRQDELGEFLWNLGLGFFSIKEKEDLNYYYGIRTEIYHTEYLYVGPTVGAEYFLSKQFSLSAEAQLRGNFYYTDLFGLNTNTSVMIKFYFK